MSEYKDLSQSKSYSAFIGSPRPSMKHSTYFEVYDYLFNNYRGLPITFVEVGVLGGGSLLMWRDFFGPQARIIGVDLNPEAKELEDDGFEIFIGSQSDSEFWKTFTDAVGPVDILLDDGGHTYEQQIVTTEMMLQNIRDGGLLVVEDTHTSYQDGFGARRHSFINYVKRLMDLINFRHWSLKSSRKDHRVWSIEIFDSIVAFRINETATFRTSTPVDNGKKFSGAAFRYSSSVKLRASRVNSFASKIPGVKLIALGLRRAKINLSSRVKLWNYFK